MKLMNLACAMLVVISMASCTAESVATMNYEEVAFSLEKNYNARSVNYVEGSKNDLGLSELPPVSVQEAEGILKQLREKKGLTANHSLESKEGEPGQKFLTVSAECCVSNAHKLTLQLSMISYEDDASLYYKDYKAFASSQLYKWHMNGFGLSTAGTSGMYKFDCSSYLYFKIVDEGITYIQVPVKVAGEYNPSTHEINFTYTL